MRKLKLKYKGKVLEGIEVGTTLLEVSKLVKDDYKYPIVGAKIGSYITDLNTKVTKNEKVEFYDLSSTIGNRIYSRSLEFLTTYASKKVLGSDTDVMINYSLENGIYCEIVGKKINSISINKIEEEMKNLVKEKLPFTSIIVDRVEAINYLKRHGQKDKGYILKYLTDDTISVYQLENGYDYFYGSLVHDTSVLKKFELKYNKNNSFILLYPTASSPNRIKKYIEHPLTNNTYKNFTEWGWTCECQQLVLFFSHLHFPDTPPFHSSHSTNISVSSIIR